jgi:hypothetical protein
MLGRAELEHEIHGKPRLVPPDCLQQGLSRHAVEHSEVEVDDDSLAADEPNPVVRARHAQITHGVLFGCGGQKL